MFYIIFHIFQLLFKLHNLFIFSIQTLDKFLLNFETALKLYARKTPLVNMNIPDYLQFLEPIQEQLNKIYSITSLALTVLICLWLFNFIVGLIQRTYSVGKAIGSFYRNYFHKYFRKAIVGVLNTFKKTTNTNAI